MKTTNPNHQLMIEYVTYFGTEYWQDEVSIIDQAVIVAHDNRQMKSIKREMKKLSNK